MENKELAPVREISVVTAEIIELKRQARNTALYYIIEIGRRLTEAKSVLPHGEWANWLENEVEFSQSSANNFMKLYDEYGSQQLSLFGAVSNSQSFANLPYTKALLLIGVDKEEREEFAKEVDAEHCSVSELKQAIKERDEAKKRAAELETINKASAEADEKLKAATAEIEELKKDLLFAEEKMKTETEKLKKKIENPTVPKEKVDELTKKAESDAKAKYEKQISNLQSKIADAETAKRRLEGEVKMSAARLKEAEDKIKLQNPDISAFETLFKSVQQTISQMQSLIVKIGESDDATAKKLETALKALGERL